MALYLWRASANSYADREWKVWRSMFIKKMRKRFRESSVKSTLPFSTAVMELRNFHMDSSDVDL